MKLRIFKALISIGMFIGLIFISYTINKPISVQAQQPTGVIPTVTGLPTGPTGTIKVGLVDHVAVRSGPSTLCDTIGVILPGMTVEVAGQTIAGDWLLIKYPGVSGGEGWVWALYIDVKGGELPVVELPPTPTPKVTTTIDPTMAAQFVITPENTKLPTFTAPPPLTIPTYSTGVIGNGRIPVGLVILILAGLGILIGLISMIQSR